MSKSNEPVYYQHFVMHMKNGEKVDFYEDYDIPDEKGIIGAFTRAFTRGEKKTLQANGHMFSYIVPFDQISFIEIADVEVVG